MVHERISAGGMAEVFRGTEHGFDDFEREVAIKRILPHIASDPEFIRMFNAEAKLAVQLKHGNIAEIYRLGQQDDSFYIALEYIHGRDLRAIFHHCQASGGALPIPLCCYVLSCVCEGLDYAHTKQDRQSRPLKLIHRDVSPPNVMVAFDGQVKIIDFGLAKFATAQTETQAGMIKGKLAYLSPEQAHGQEIDHRSDIFSTGTVLFEVLTGQRLFIGENDLETVKNVRKCNVPRPSSINPRIPWRLERIVFRALAKDVGKRYQSAGDMYEDLRHFMMTAGIRHARQKMNDWMQDHFEDYS
jgi:serine/threonine-protein kinase